MLQNQASNLSHNLGKILSDKEKEFAVLVLENIQKLSKCPLYVWGKVNTFTHQNQHQSKL